MLTMPLGLRHIWIVAVASLGQMIGTAVATLAGVIIPMINIIRHPELSSAMQGLIGAADLIGITIGSVVFGRLSDRFGYLVFFRGCPALVLVASVAAALIPDTLMLAAMLFVIGIGIGGEYSLDSDYISELMPLKWRSLMGGAAKTMSALGNIVVALLCYICISDWKTAARWPDLMWIVAAMATLMLLSRIFFYQSPKWLQSHGKTKAAEKAVADFLGKNVYMPIATPHEEEKTNSASNVDAHESGKSFLCRYRNKIILSGMPWACEGLGVYGIGVFLPVLVMALGIEHANEDVTAIMHVASSVWTTFLISCIILPGFIIGLLLIKRNHNILTMQTVGFTVCAAALSVLMAAYCLHWNRWISIAAFMIFELFLNIGPHLVTFVLPPRLYPVDDRGTGTGIAAAMGKAGAVVAVFIIPLLLKAGGPPLVLAVSAIVMLAGAAFTFVFGRIIGWKTGKGASC